MAIFHVKPLSLSQKGDGGANKTTQEGELAKILLIYYIISEIVNLVLLVFSHALSTSHKKEK